MQKFYDKRMNLLIHGIKEDDDNIWGKKRDKTIEKFKIFLINNLKIKDLDDMEYIDLHRASDEKGWQNHTQTDYCQIINYE